MLTVVGFECMHCLQLFNLELYPHTGQALPSTGAGALPELGLQDLAPSWLPKIRESCNSFVSWAQVMQPLNCMSGFISCGWHFLNSQAWACKGLSSVAWEIFGSCGNAQLHRSWILQLLSLPLKSQLGALSWVQARRQHWAVFSEASQRGWFSLPKPLWF